MVKKNQEVSITGTSKGSILSGQGSLPTGVPDFTNILSNPNLTKQQKAKAILQAKGVRRPRKIYNSVEARKAAAEARRKERHAKDIAELPEELRPRAKVRRTAQEKVQLRSAYNKKKNASDKALREWAINHPDILKQAGLNIHLPKHKK